MRRAMAAVHPDDIQHFLTLQERPEATFSLIRPFLDPSQDSLSPLQSEVGRTIMGSPHVDEWAKVGVMRTSNLGLTYLDGEPLTYPNSVVPRSVNAFSLAVNVCAEMPPSVAEPLSAVLEGAYQSSVKSSRYIVAAGVMGGQALGEYAVPNTARHHLSGIYKFIEPNRAIVRLAVIDKPRKMRGMPRSELAGVIEDVLAPESTVQFDRLRLRVHLPGQSPYYWIK